MSIICDLRKKQGLSQGDLAKLLGVSRQAVSKWENDLAIPEQKHLITMAEIFDVNVEYLMTGKEPAPSPPAPIVVNLVKKVDKVVEKTVEKPVIKKVVRIKYKADPVSCVVVGVVSLILGILIGALCF